MTHQVPPRGHSRLCSITSCVLNRKIITLSRRARDSPPGSKRYSPRPRNPPPLSRRPRSPRAHADHKCLKSHSLTHALTPLRQMRGSSRVAVVVALVRRVFVSDVVGGVEVARGSGERVLLQRTATRHRGAPRVPPSGQASQGRKLVQPSATTALLLLLASRTS